MGNCNFSQKADCKRISTTVDVRYFWGKLFALGNVSDISKSCMCINTKYCLPLNSSIELLLQFNNRILTIPVKINGYSHTNTLQDSMSVDVLNPSKEYLEFMGAN
jgi:hypothetical protein